MLLSGWWSIPTEQQRLADQLGFGLPERFRLLEMPMLREVVLGALLLIFLIRLASFAVALTLGGGPRATTLELGIYQAVWFEFNLLRAASLSYPSQRRLGRGHTCFGAQTACHRARRSSAWG